MRHLLTKKYEPLHSATFKDLTKKALFLVALATAKRVRELQGVFRIASFSNGDAFSQYLPEFVPKTDSVDHSIPRDFRIKALTRIVTRDDPEWKLCPVRALQYYLKAIDKRLNHPRNLFAQFEDETKAMSKNSLSYLLRILIKEAHETQPEADYPRGDIRAHSIRMVATFLNFMKNRSIAKVMEAATWRGNTTFTSLYLKDVERIYEHCRSLDPINARNTQL